MANDRYRKPNGDKDKDEPLEAEIIKSSEAYTALVRGEIDVQIATAHAYPREIARFQDRTRELACVTKEVAKSCTYALPRGGKELIGPSVRMAEIVATAWGNLRTQVRLVGCDAHFVTVECSCHDLETNNAIAIPVQRRITGRDGQRYNDDMINVATAAAIAVARRNAVFVIVPRANWEPIWMEARNVARGVDRPFTQVRQEAIDDLTATHKVTPETLLKRVGCRRIDDMTLEDYDLLAALDTAIKEGHTTAAVAFAPPAPEEGLPAPKAEPEYLARNVALEAEMQRNMATAATPPPPPPGNGAGKAALMARYVELRKGFSAQDLHKVAQVSGVAFVNNTCSLEDLERVVAAAEDVAASR